MGTRAESFSVEAFMPSVIDSLFGSSQPLIGMLHAPPLPGSPEYGGDWPAVESHVLHDAQVLAESGMHGLLLENFGDAPFFPTRVPAATIAHLTALAASVRRRFSLPLGINVLRNDARAALAIAHAAGAQFIRVNVLCGARVTDQGLVQASAHNLLRDRKALGALGVKIFADVDVKHSAPLAARPLEEEVQDLNFRGRADALIVSGQATGKPTDPEKLRAVRAAAASTPVLVGSGATAASLASYLPLADGVIVGSTLKREGRVHEPVDAARVKELVDAWRSARG
jgi:membrane complex biogenesis BtpA family protein